MCTLPVGMQMAACTCKCTVGVSTQRPRLWRTSWDSLGFGSRLLFWGWVWICRNLGLSYKILFSLFWGTWVKLECEWLLQMHQSPFEALHQCRRSAGREVCALLNSCPCLVGGGGGSYQKQVQGPLLYRTKPVLEDSPCWLLLPFTQFHHAFPRNFEEEWIYSTCIASWAKIGTSPELPCGNRYSELALKMEGADEVQITNSSP